MDDATLDSTKALINKEHVHKLSELAGKADWDIIKKSENVKISLHGIKTRHIKDYEDTYGIKIKFETGSECYVWGYTSDTSYFDELAFFFKGCQTLLFNISDIYIKDVREIKSKNAHLGFYGSIKLLDAIRPSLALATEFCCMNGDYSHEIVRALKERLRDTDIYILPADRGLEMSIAGRELECTLCKADCPVENIRVARSEKEFEKIHYICPNCLI